MAAVVLEVVLSGAGFHDMPQKDRWLGCGHREAHRRHTTGPIVPLQDLRAPSPQPLQVLLVSDIPHFSTHTTTNNRPPRCSGLRGAQRHRATPTHCTAAHGRPAGCDEVNKVLPLVSNLGDTILTHFRPRHTLNTFDLLYNYPILPIHTSRDHRPATDRLMQTLPHSHDLT